MAQHSFQKGRVGQVVSRGEDGNHVKDGIGILPKVS